ncbi:MAG TPA: alpha/beta fold hydrolase [Desulfomonilia bacterium]|nr:alpha/beta fold hydrolase [Desulfomonilia bacterium]
MQGKRTNNRIFTSRAFHYQALRTMGHSAAFAANPGECLAAVGSIRSGDTDSWYESWHEFGQKCSKIASASNDTISRGKALLRASNYFRTSEFFLNPTDTRRLSVYRESANAFTRALQVLSIPHKIWKIPYDRASMRAYYFPGDPDKPVILACGGYDSTNEESFFWIAAAARERGYPCVMFEGPGQSNMIREYDIKFTHEWEKPVTTLLDFMQWEAPELSGHRKILLGISMGAMLALRAAAMEKRIDAAAGYGGFFSMKDAAFAQIPPLGRLFYRLKLKDMFNSMAHLRASRDTGVRWALDNGCWTIGAQTPFELIEKTSAFSIAPVADKITCDVLILIGETDHLIPMDQSVRFRQHIKNARSFREHTFREEDGAGEHCQAGALEQFHQVFFEWVQGLFR